MIYTTAKGETLDTDRDFSAAERHILQKLLLWTDLAASVEEFRRKKQESLYKGWGDSGPIPESRAMHSLTQDLEKKVALRLRTERQEN